MQEYGIDQVAKVLCKATQKTLQKGAGLDIVFSKTIQKVEKISLRPDLGCFVQFYGDYNGLVVVNFSGEIALEVYRSYMTTMGLPEDELAKEWTSVEVADTIGEIINQIMGSAVRMIESRYDLGVKFGQPKALVLNNAITLSLESSIGGISISPDVSLSDNRRITFKQGSQRFHMEISMERSQFLEIE